MAVLPSVANPNPQGTAFEPEFDQEVFRHETALMGPATGAIGTMPAVEAVGPDGRTMSQIVGTSYQSDAERVFFFEQLGGTAPAITPTAPSGDIGAFEAALVGGTLLPAPTVEAVSQFAENTVVSYNSAADDAARADAARNAAITQATIESGALSLPAQPRGDELGKAIAASQQLAPIANTATVAVAPPRGGPDDFRRNFQQASAAFIAQARASGGDEAVARVRAQLPQLEEEWIAALIALGPSFYYGVQDAAGNVEAVPKIGALSFLGGRLGDVVTASVRTPRQGGNPSRTIQNRTQPQLPQDAVFDTLEELRRRRIGGI